MILAKNSASYKKNVDWHSPEHTMFDFLLGGCYCFLWVKWCLCMWQHFKDTQKLWSVPPLCVSVYQVLVDAFSEIFTNVVQNLTKLWRSNHMGFICINKCFASTNEISGCTEVHLACDRGHIKVIQLLMKLGSDFNVAQKKYQRLPCLWTSSDFIEIYYAFSKFLGPSGSRLHIDPRAV